MNPLAKLAGFAVVLVLALVLGLGVGAAVGPIDVGGDDAPAAEHGGDGTPTSDHGDGDHGWGS